MPRTTSVSPKTLAAIERFRADILDAIVFHSEAATGLERESPADTVSITRNKDAETIFWEVLSWLDMLEAHVTGTVNINPGRDHSTSQARAARAREFLKMKDER